MKDPYTQLNISIPLSLKKEIEKLSKEEKTSKAKLMTAAFKLYKSTRD